jgi:hypothetical protein
MLVIVKTCSFIEDGVKERKEKGVRRTPKEIGPELRFSGLRDASWATSDVDISPFGIFA